MPYDDDDDLFSEEFDFVDDDDSATEPSDVEAEEKPEKKPAKKPPASRGKPPAKPPARPRSRDGKAPSAPAGGNRRPARRDEEPAPAPPSAPAPAPVAANDFDERAAMDDDEPAALPTPDPSGPPADHVIHIYQYGKFARTIPRKFTDEEAVNFAEEYTRTGKAYGRYAIATPDDEEPAAEFADAAKG